MDYRSLFTFRVEHEYFDRGICRSFRCRISPAEAALWHRRGLLFRQLGENGWTILYDNDGAGVDTSSDVLVLDMEMTDPAFVLYTLWDGFHPNAAYGLELPLKKETADAVKVIRETAPRRGIGSGFCRIRIRMTDKLVKAAQDGKPMTCTLQFHSRPYTSQPVGVMAPVLVKPFFSMSWLKSLFAFSIVIVFSSLRLLQQTSQRKLKKPRPKSKKQRPHGTIPCGCCFFAA